jgi:probable H4MPT-linked C1 transfer pathway protein
VPVAKIIGWDIGGVHTKAVWLPGGELDKVEAISKSFEIWRAHDKLPEILNSVYTSLAASAPDAMAVTMTAELADTFESKRQGVRFILDSLRCAFPFSPIYLLDIQGRMVTLETALQRPDDFAAANWLASAMFVATHQPDCLLVDVGSTTTDITPIRAGHPVVEGRSDTARLAAGELVYTGVVRTNPNTVVPRVPVQGRACAVAAEYFTVMADVYLLLGHLQTSQYTTSTPDGRPKSAQAAQQRLARLVCADAETLGPADILHIARYLHEKQLQQVTEALCQVLSRLPGDHLPLLPAGIGHFLATEAGQRLCLSLVELAIPDTAAAVLPSLAVACLLEENLSRRHA